MRLGMDDFLLKYCLSNSLKYSVIYEGSSFPVLRAAQASANASDGVLRISH